MEEKKIKKSALAMSKRKRFAVIGLAIVIAVAIVWIDNRKGKNLRKAIQQKNPYAGDFDKYHENTFTVINVVDGDTVDIDAADGKYDHTRIRLLGLDTPETKTSGEPMHFAREATQFTSHFTLNKKVTVLLDEVSEKRDKYGRLLAWLRLDDGSSLNEKLVKEGFAYADLRFKNSRFDKLVELQAQARKSKAGLWREAKKTDLPKWLQRERPDLLKSQPR